MLLTAVAVIIILKFLFAEKSLLDFSLNAFLVYISYCCLSSICVYIVDALNYHFSLLQKIENTGKEDLGPLDKLIRAVIVFFLLMYPRNMKYFFPKSGIDSYTKAVQNILAGIFPLIKTFFLTGFLFSLLGVQLFGGRISLNPNAPGYSNLAITNVRYNNTLRFG